MENIQLDLFREHTPDVKARFKQALNVERLEQVKKDIREDEKVRTLLDNKLHGAVEAHQIEQGYSVLDEYRRFVNFEGTENNKESTDQYWKPDVILKNGLLTTIYRPRDGKGFKAPSKRRLDISDMSIDNQQADLYTLENKEMGMALAISEIMRIYEEYADGKKITGIWLHGANQIGKSYLVTALAKALNKEKKAGAIVISVITLLDKIKKTFNDDSRNTEKALQRFYDVDFLALDDIGAEPLSDWNIDGVLYKIIDERFKRNKLTVFTSNMTRADYVELLKRFRGKGLDQQGAKTRGERFGYRLFHITKEVQANGKRKTEFY